MAKKENITIGGLGLSIVALIALATGEVKTKLEAFKADLDAFGLQPVPADPAIATLQKEKIALDKQVLKLTRDLNGKAELVKALTEKGKVFQAESGATIKELKDQLKTAQDKQIVKSDFLTVEIDGEKLRVMHGAYPHSAKELAENPELAREVYLIPGQNAIVKI